MKKIPLCISLVSGLLWSASLQAATIATVGSYDATTANNVDTDVTGTLASFKSAVTAASAAGFGGVANFDITGSTFTSDTALNFTYGGGAKTLSVVSDIAQNTAVVSGSGTVSPITGGNVLTRVSSATPDTTFTITAPVGELVSSFAFTILERNVYAVEGVAFTVTAYFSNGSNSGGITSTIGDINLTTSDKGLDDSFWSFNAPTGYSITSIFIDSAGTTNSTASQPAFDDIAFITTPIPEPSCVLLIGAGLGSAALRRRRA